ncbi:MULTISPECIES: glycogen synthase GlgA [Rhizobium/Agrobacterium group]|uniref:Glycogen synthase n=1 Tax=Neorhizobium petrolearium TaxID=515361 RepID=A0ABY8LZS0_9HYPH|nr:MULTISPECIES: glycogen synthase GlgA [Rhizobium/Agrobacterium group]KGD91996.1 glycogen synthase [Rhizobium sp. YS-1r]MCC2611521.1 glycogen synthase GlgA [Neorhizobium petrolearium]WGI66710.1 glycogen synthase GlgA [Neorhizobium petrolearium]
MQVLSVASEVYPLIKTGGLADVAGALPLALKGYGVSVKTLMPGYPAVMRMVENATVRMSFESLLGAKADVLEVEHQGLDLLILDSPTFFDRPGGPYADATGKDHFDNWRRFAALSKAGAIIAQGGMAQGESGWQPDIVHVHDWQAAMVPAYMRYAAEPEIPTLVTIHNIAFQGQFGADIFPYLELPPHAFGIGGVEYFGGVGYLKAGLQTGWAISTVSPSYAEEILTPEFGMGLEGLLAYRAADLHGIVNGIDTGIWNPATDTAVKANYTAASLKTRAENKRAVAERFGLIEDDGPLFCVISRLTWQKGMDLLAEAVGDLVELGARLAVLGSGDRALENAFHAAAAHHPGRIAVLPTYDEPLSHLMQAGSDAIIIPSRFEPCGLTQLYGLRYGCIPVVARTGGLNDTVIDASHAALAAKTATGVSFGPVTAGNLRRALRRAVRLYRDPKVWTAMQKQGMKSDVSWEKSAGLYAELYKNLLARKGS